MAESDPPCCRPPPRGRLASEQSVSASLLREGAGRFEEFDLEAQRGRSGGSAGTGSPDLGGTTTLVAAFDADPAGG